MWDELKADSLVGEAKLDKVFLQAVEDHMERSSKRFAFSLPVWRPCHADQSVEEELVRESAARRSMRSKLVDWVQRCSVWSHKPPFLRAFCQCCTCACLCWDVAVLDWGSLHNGCADWIAA